MFTTKKTEIIDKKEFGKTLLDENIEVFLVYMKSFNLSLMSIYLTKKAQIALLITKKVKILVKYSDFLNIFLEEKTLILPEIINLNQHAIKFQKN